MTMQPEWCSICAAELLLRRVPCSGTLIEDAPTDGEMARLRTLHEMGSLGPGGYGVACCFAAGPCLLESWERGKRFIRITLMRAASQNHQTAVFFLEKGKRTPVTDQSVIFDTCVRFGQNRLVRSRHFPIIHKFSM